MIQFKYKIQTHLYKVFEKKVYTRDQCTEIKLTLFAHIFFLQIKHQLLDLQAPRMCQGVFKLRQEILSHLKKKTTSCNKDLWRYFNGKFWSSISTVYWSMSRHVCKSLCRTKTAVIESTGKEKPLITCFKWSTFWFLGLFSLNILKHSKIYLSWGISLKSDF